MTAGNEPDEEALQGSAADPASIAPDVLPNDPLLVAGFYHLKSATGSTKGANVINVWDDYRGAGVRVALIDDGFEYTHPDLAANYDTALDYDARDGDFDAYTTDPADEHGTATAGTIAAAADNGIGGAGVAPEATIVGLRIGFGANGSVEQVVAAFAHATAVDVINNSWAFDGLFPDGFGAGIVQPVVENGRGGLGTVVVFSAGNARSSDDNVNYHGFQNYRGVITVAATDSAGNIAGFSTPGDAILVSAPGVSIQTTDRVGSAGFSSGDFTTLNGTSFSAPIVSGIAALMLEANPDLGWRDVQEILASTAIQTGSPVTWGFNHAGNWNGGAMHVSSDFGFGLMDALAAVRVAESWRETSTSANEMVVQSSSGQNAAIPNPGTLQRTLVLGGGIRIDHVEIDISISHPEISDLRITLTSPTGTQSVLFDTPSTFQGDISWTFSSTHFWGELSNGTWTLGVQDTINQAGSADAGTLLDWSLRAFGDPTGDDVYVYTDEFGALAGSDPSRLTLNDTGGTDDINTAAVASATSLDLRPGHTSVIDGQNVTTGAGTVIENADTGDGNDTLIGNDAANSLRGWRGDDILDGGAGPDTMAGGPGNDTYVVDPSDTVIEDANAGTDTIQAPFTYSIAAAPNLENITLTGGAPANATGNAADNVLLGNSAANVLTGGLGNDTYGIDAADTIVENANEGIDTVLSPITYSLAGTSLENITLIGTDPVNATGNDADNVLLGNSADNVLTGGLGNDTYGVDNASDVVVENAGEGTDTVRSSITYSIASAPDLENITLVGTAAINATGNAGENVLVGNSAGNVLTGGAGSDTYYVGAGDSVIEAAGGGTDTAYSDATFTLGAEVENLILTGAAAINGTGNALDNLITGNDAANVLNGGGGVDTLIGGLGNDTYVVDTTTDTIVENAGEGTDTVQPSVNYSIAALPNVENITLTGSNPINATGNAGDNVLNGSTSGGANVLAGGAGNDTYVVGANDTVIENPNEGTDTVQSSATYSLAGLPDVENLTLTLSASVNGTGNALNNVLTGNFGANVLDGGAGIDTLIGAGGNDTYIVDNTTDTVTELVAQGTDTVQSSVTYSIAALANLENVTLTGSGSINATGNAGANVLTGNGSGNNLTGGGGDDTYVFNAGFGQDTVIDNDATAGNQDTVHFGSGITPASVAVSRTGMNLILTNGPNKVTVQHWFASDADKIERVDFTGDPTVWDVPTLQAMAGGNSPPVNTVPGTQSALEDTAKVISGIGVADPDGNPLTTTLTMTNGTISVNAGVSGGAGVSGNGTGTITLTGSQSAINATLAAATGVTYNPASNFNGAATLTVVSGDGTASDTDLVTVNVTAVNDAPAFVKGADQTVSEDAPAQSITGWATGITPGPADEAGQTLTFNVTGNTNPGLFAAAPAISAGGALTYTPAANANGTALLTVTIADSGGTANGGVDTSGPQTFSITINAVNDPPVNAVPGPQAVNEDTNLTVMGVSVSDVEAATVQVTVSAANGALTLSQTTGLSFSAGDGTSDATMTFSGIQANVNTALGNLVYRGSLNYNGADTITLTTSDLGATGSGGTLTDTDTISITVNPVNDAPTVAIAIPDQSGTTGAAFNYTVPANSFADVDAGDTLGYGATRADGSALPAWLNFTAATHAFSGTPTAGDAGVVSVKVTATDSQSASAFDVFDISVTTGGVTINGTSGADTLNGTAGNDTINGLGGTDTLNGLDGNDILNGGPGIDTMNGGTGDDTVLITGVDGTNYDVVNGGAGFDTILGGAGDDTFRLWNYTGANTVERIDGGAGVNVIAANASTGTVLDFSGTELLNISQIVGGTGADTITGSAGNDVIIGGANNDTMNGGAGDDTFLILGTDGTSYDVVNGGAGFDTILGGAGDDTFRLWSYSGANTVERIDGGAGVNVIAAVTAFGTTLDLSGTQLLNISQIVGGTGADTITGSAGNDVIAGGAGNDTLRGGAGNDTLDGGSGNDTMIGGTGADIYVMDSASDVVTEDATEGTDTVQSTLTYSIAGAANLENVTLTGTSSINATGNTGANILTGNSAANTLDGGAGNDTLAGGGGNDLYLLNAGFGQDLVSDTDITAGNQDVVRFGSGITPASVVVSRSGMNLILTNGANAVTVQNWFASDADKIERVEFTGDPTVWDVATLQAMAGGGGGNAPPVNTLPGAQSAVEDTTKIVPGISVADADAGANPLTMTLTVTNGTVTVNAGVAGGAAVSGNGTATITLTGSQNAINATLADASGVTYNPASNFNGAATLTVMSDDGTATDTDTVTINVAAANDAPVNAVPGTQTVNEDTNLTIPGVGISDADAPSVQVTLSAAHGVISLSQTGGLGFSAGDGTSDATMTFSGTQASVNAALGNLVYRANLDYNGPDTIGMVTSDLGATGSGGTLTDTDTISITINPVNDTPTLAIPIPDQSATAGAAFNYTVPANSFADVDTGDTLGYGATRADGSALPAWLNFTAATHAFSGTPTAGDAGVVSVKVTATDSQSASAFDVFDISVTTGGVTINGTSGADTLNGTAGNDTINGLGGTDTLNGLDGNDILNGGPGIDTMNGGTGDDTFPITGVDGTNYDVVNGGAGFDTILGGAGDDTFRLWNYTGANTVERIDGGAGVNVIAANASTGTVLDFSGTELLNISQIVGGTGADTITGSAGNDVIIGGMNNDTMNGGAGDDTFLILGTDGTSYDVVNGGTGFDTILGGAGDDTFRLWSYSGANTVERIDGGAGVNVIAAVAAFGTTLDLSGTQLFNISQIVGGTGADVITGSAGNDSISGDAGNDTLNGSAGSDTLTGGGGNDTFAFQPGQAQGDTVLDFTGNGIPGGDLLRFAGFGAGATLAQSGTTDYWIINYGAQSETIQLAGITTLSAGDYQFV